MEEYRVLGIMSGTSLDGVDIACTIFGKNNSTWNFKLERGITYPYNEEWKSILQSVRYSTAAFELLKLDQEYGVYLGNLVNNFIKETGARPQVIASHGHTIFHQPSKGITCQIGNGNSIAATTGLPVVCDFRSKDVALGGQGAPLVPFGDLMLFPEYKYCLNFGGFANISIKEKDQISAFDICPVNIILNTLVADVGMEYDKDGELGKNGKVNFELLKALNNLGYYTENGPKSLGKEWLEENFLPILYCFNIPIEDKVRTIYSHIADQVVGVLKDDKEKILLTGGGALNVFLVSLLKSRLNRELVVPENDMVCFKEALVFAFLGLMRFLGRNNVLSSVTGARDNSCGGALFA